MNETQLDAGLIQLLLVVVCIIPVIFFFITQYRTLELVRPENRRMASGLVWLQFIPFFGLIWQFYVIRKISDSIRDELNTPIGDSIFEEGSFATSHRPTYNAGMSYAAFFCISLLPFQFFRGIAALIGIGMWIKYWIELSHYKKQLKERALLLP